jgi:hypothetical protein|tara:strand:+ start:2557 stop:2841 length:285 start_codon:yes stop_codon:yes gene_type:complete
MKLNYKQKEILKLLIKNKGQTRTQMMPKGKYEKRLDDIVKLYLKGLLNFQKKYDIDIVGPINEDKVKFYWYELMIDKKKTIKDLKTIVKEGRIE